MTGHNKKTSSNDFFYVERGKDRLESLSIEDALGDEFFEIIKSLNICLLNKYEEYCKL